MGNAKDDTIDSNRLGVVRQWYQIDGKKPAAAA